VQVAQDAQEVLREEQAESKEGPVSKAQNSSLHKEQSVAIV
jgi:hypothetical protein